MRRLWAALVLCLCASALSQWNASALGSFGIASLSDRAAGARLASRFRAHGNPVFLIGNLSLGLQQGDIMRFSDRAVLIDGDVWQTLKSEGALAGLRVAPVVRVKARSRRDAWSSRAQAVGGQERKAYELGERLLRSMEGAMPSLPDGQKLSLSFEAGQMVLMVPPGFLEHFRLPHGNGEEARRPEPVKERPRPQGTPHLIFPLPGTVFAGIPLRLQSWVVDDSGGSTAGMRIACEGALPPGLSWNASERVLEGTPNQEGNYPLTLRATAPGGEDTLTFILSVHRNRPPFLKGIPDSVRAGSSWSFCPQVGDSDQPLSELHIFARQLPRGARWDSLQGCVSWHPSDSDLATVPKLRLVALDPLGDSTAEVLTIPVATARQKLPPRFLSELGLGDPHVDAPLSYRPVAVSPQGDSLRLRVQLPPGSPIRWDGEHLQLRAATPGIYAAELIAEDTHGLSARQAVAWDVRPAHRTTTFLETRHQGDLEPWQVGLDFGTGRIGFFTPSIGRLTGWNKMEDQEWPYVFIGANLLDEASRARGNRLSGDLGLTMRIPKNNLYTGGFFGRLSGRLVAHAVVPWETEFDVQGWIRQAVMIADSNVLTTISLTPSQQSQFKVNDSRWTANKMLTVRDSYWESVQKVLDQARADDNIVLLSSLWGWTPLLYGLKAGLGVWRLDEPLAALSQQSLGLGLKGAWTLGRLGLEPSIHGGWGPQGAGFSAWGAVTASLDVSSGRR